MNNLKPRQIERMHNILIMKPGAIGDLIQLIPVIHALRNHYPDSSISLLVGSSATAELFRYNADVRETIVYDKNGDHRSFFSLLTLWRRLQKNRYDIIINFQRSNLKIWFLASAAFPCRVLTYHKTANRSVHAVENYLRTLVPLGIETRDINMKLAPGPEDKAFAEKVVSSVPGTGTLLVALNPGASHAVNRWSTASFAALADLLSNRLSARIIIVGGRDDRPLAEDIASRAKTRPFILTGAATLLQAAAVLERCDVLVSGDTGPMHLAAAVGTRVVALFGAADPARTGPVGAGHRVIRAEGIACVPCRKRTCENKQYLECMQKIPVDSVFNAVTEIAGKK
jgi:ADP-heptose:LPS heptosyltransferase